MATIEAKMRNGYVAAGGKNVGVIDFMALIEILLGLFTECPISVTKRWARRHPEKAIQLIEDQIKEDEISGLTTARNRKAAAESAHKVFLSTPDKELEALRKKLA